MIPAQKRRLSRQIWSAIPFIGFLAIVLGLFVMALGSMELSVRLMHGGAGL